jgi:hypothetical protein
LYDRNDIFLLKSANCHDLAPNKQIIVVALNIYRLARCQWLTPVIQTTWEAETVAQGQFKCSRDPNSKITRAKWTGGVTQAIEHLHYKHKALSSNPSLTKYIHVCMYTYIYMMEVWPK